MSNPYDPTTPHNYGPPQTPKKPHHWYRPRNVFLACVAFIVLIIVIAVVTSGGNTVTTNTPQAGSAQPAATQPAYSPSASPTPTTLADGTVGSSFTATDQNNNKYDITLVKVIDPAQSSDQYTTPDNGTHFVAAVFTIKGVSGTASDDANNDATVVGSDSQDYDSGYATTSGYTNFNNGDWTVAPGHSVTGEVTFQVPNEVKVSSIQWTLDSGFGKTATWDV